MILRVLCSLDLINIIFLIRSNFSSFVRSSVNNFHVSKFSAVVRQLAAELESFEIAKPCLIKFVISIP